MLHITTYNKNSLSYYKTILITKKNQKTKGTQTYKLVRLLLLLLLIPITPQPIKAPFVANTTLKHYDNNQRKPQNQRNH